MNEEGLTTNPLSPMGAPPPPAVILLCWPLALRPLACLRTPSNCALSISPSSQAREGATSQPQATQERARHLPEGDTEGPSHSLRGSHRERGWSLSLSSPSLSLAPRLGALSSPVIRVSILSLSLSLSLQDRVALSLLLGFDLLVVFYPLAATLLESGLSLPLPLRSLPPGVLMLYYLALIFGFCAFGLSFLWYAMVSTAGSSFRIDWRRELPPLCCCIVTGAWMLFLVLG